MARNLHYGIGEFVVILDASSHDTVMRLVLMCIDSLGYRSVDEVKFWLLRYQTSQVAEYHLESTLFIC